MTPPDVMSSGDVAAAITAGYSAIMDTADRFSKRQEVSENLWDVTQPRWKILLDENDSKTIWKPINWKGKIELTNAKQPSDEQFKE